MKRSVVVGYKNNAIMLHDDEPNRAWRLHRGLRGLQMMPLLGQSMEELSPSPHKRKLAKLNEPTNFTATVVSLNALNLHVTLQGPSHVRGPKLEPVKLESDDSCFQLTKKKRKQLNKKSARDGR